MMNKDDYRHFVCIVAGDNPNEIIKQYKKKKGNFVAYKYKDAEKLRRQYIKVYESLLTNKDLNKIERESIEESLDIAKTSTNDEFYYLITDGYEYDDETGDALTTEDPEGKFESYKMGKFFSVPFITIDGRETFQARKNEIDWPKMHLSNNEVYEDAWDLVMEGKKPETEMQQTIYDNMKNRTVYFNKFKNRAAYVLFNTAFWGYAFVSDKCGWKELEDNIDQVEWVGDYYDTFIDPLPDDTLLTIYECVR